jgi:hypothetical protein
VLALTMYRPDESPDDWEPLARKSNKRALDANFTTGDTKRQSHSHVVVDSTNISQEAYDLIF